MPPSPPRQGILSRGPGLGHHPPRCAAQQDMYYSPNRAFAAAPDKGPFPYKGLHLLLIDDVCTSGKTLRDLALRLLPNAPLAVYGLIYLKSHNSPGLAIA